MGHVGTRRSIRALPRAPALWLLVGLGQIDFSYVKKLMLAFRIPPAPRVYALHWVIAF